MLTLRTRSKEQRTRMKLVEDFYDIIERRDEGAESIFRVALRPDCKVYEGHVPGEPVAPGVCNIQMILECAEEVAGKPLMLGYIAQCRMTKLITPAECPTLEVKIQLEGENLVASITSGEELCLTLKGTVN